jgi:hypothetical protein
MTEEEWLTVGKLNAHVDYQLLQKATRKLRLFSIGCTRQLLPWAEKTEETILHDALLRAEKLADGELSESTIEKWYRKVRELERTQSHMTRSPQTSIIHNFVLICLPTRYAGFTDGWRKLVGNGQIYGEEFARQGSGLAHSLLLDIFGNPFRPVAFNPAWRTSTAVGVAQAMYDAREFNAMPILADALQDAGCEDNAILSHCQGAGPHVRGCWVVDLVLNKS